MPSRMAGYKGEYLWELDVPEIQLLALAEAIPEELYDWRPAEGMRTFSAVLVHIAASNFLLLDMAGMDATEDLYDHIGGDGYPRIIAMVRENLRLEATVAQKHGVIDLLKRSFDAVRQTFANAGEEELERSGQFFGEWTTVRRVYLRMLAHSHEHMGQAVAYARACGIPAPWPDPLKEFGLTAEAAGA